MNVVTIPLTMDALLALWAMRTGDEKSASQTILRMTAGDQQFKEQEIVATFPASAGTGKFPYEILGEKR